MYFPPSAIFRMGSIILLEDPPMKRLLTCFLFSCILVVTGMPEATAQIATHAVISEALINGATSTEVDEFVELYNPTGSAIVFAATDTLMSMGGTGTNLQLVALGGFSIPAGGFLLIGDAGAPSNTPDIIPPSYSLTNSGGSILLRMAGVTVDAMGWGTPLFKEGTALPGSPTELTSYERKTKSTSTADSMIIGGGDEFEGNGWDFGDNSSDFIVRPVSPGPQAQNNASPAEVPPVLPNSPPIIGGLARSLYVPEVGGADSVTASISDVDGVVISPRVHMRVNGGAYDSVSMTLVSGSTYRGIIPSTKHTTAGHLVEYFVTALDDSGHYSSTSATLKGYFVGDCPVDSIKNKSLASISGYGARVNGTINVRTNTFSSGQGWIQDATGGLQLFGGAGGITSINDGQNVRVQGDVSSFNGSYQLGAVNFAFVDTTLGSSTLVPDVITLPLAQSALNQYEGKLVKLLAPSTAATGSFAASTSYLYSVGADTITVRVESNSGLNSLVGGGIDPTPDSVVGILVWNADHLRLKPRKAEDLGLVANTFYAAASGPWSSTGTWLGGIVPDSTNDVVINTLGLTINIDVTNARCRNLSMVGSGSASNSGPVLEFDASGTKQLTVYGDLTLSGGGGGGGGDRGGRGKLTSNGNTSAVLIVRGDISSSSSNSPDNGDAGINMHEGTVKLLSLSVSSDTLKQSAGMRLANLEIGNGTVAKTVVTAPTTNVFLNISSLKVKAGSTFWIGSLTGNRLMTLGNSTGSGFPMLNGGIVVETGASLRVSSSATDDMHHTINLDGGGIVNDGTIDLQVPALALVDCQYTLRVGGNSQGTSGASQSFSGIGSFALADVTVDSSHTLTLLQDISVDTLTVYSGVLGLNAGATLTGVARGAQVVPYAAGWNMISNPIVTTSDSVRQLFPESSFDYAFSFNPSGGYVQRFTMDNGTGYWEKFGSSGSASMFNDYILNASIPVSAGWNLIGGLSVAVDTGDVTTVPPGIRASVYFGYSGGYSEATTLDPGKAYWVKSSAAGSFVLSSGSAPANKAAAVNPLDGFSSITITDAAGASQTLHLGNDLSGTFPVEFYEMPPLGPDGTFDTRFESGRMVEVSRDGRATQHGISIRSTAYPLTVSWNVAGEKLSLSDGVNPATVMSGSGQTIVRNPSITRLVVSTQSTELPTVFSLQQNYPNPFNPATTIRFGIPSNSKVTLRVYNILGQQVAELLNGVLESGYHETNWEATTNTGSQVSSGVYFYKLEANSLTTGQIFSEVHKMVLMK